MVAILSQLVHYYVHFLLLSLHPVLNDITMRLIWYSVILLFFFPVFPDLQSQIIEAT